MLDKGPKRPHGKAALAAGSRVSFRGNGRVFFISEGVILISNKRVFEVFDYALPSAIDAVCPASLFGWSEGLLRFNIDLFVLDRLIYSSPKPQIVHNI